jgi:hypothetical protein
MHVAEVRIASFRHLKDVHIGPLPSTLNRNRPAAAPELPCDESWRFPWWAWPLMVLLLRAALLWWPFYRRKIRGLGCRVAEYYDTPAA